MRIKILFACLFINFACYANAEQMHCSVNYDNVNLTQKQKLEMQKLDQRWQNFNATMQPAILKHKNGLNKAILNPNISENDLRNIYTQLIYNQNLLKNEAMEVFIAKRRVLTPQQRKKGVKCR